ncbi:MAG: ABC transporter ATP-binding protein [Paracoccaceae bacterium]
MLLELQSVSKSFDARPLFTDVSLQLDGGETVALTGESGSGKSTLLHLMGALDDPDSGDIRLGGTQYATLNDRGRADLRRTRIGLVFQQFNLIGSLNVAANLTFQARLAGREDQDWTGHVTARLGLNDVLTQSTETLSGGQQQRVAIGRALAARPDLLLADEPTGNLDEANSDRVLDLMLDLVQESGTALFLVTHSEGVAARLSRRLHLSQGRVS